MVSVPDAKMNRVYENPMAPPGYETNTECVLEFYMCMDDRMVEFMRDRNFKSWIPYLNENLAETSCSSEEETGAIEEEMQTTVTTATVQQNTIKLEKTDTLGYIDTLLAEYKNKSKLPDEEVKEVKSERRSSDESKQSSERGSSNDSKQTVKLNKSSEKKVHKKKKNRNSSRSSSSSTSSSTERSSRHHHSTTFVKSSVNIIPPNRRSVSPRPSTSGTKSRRSKYSTSPCRKKSSRQQYSSSIRSPSRILSPTRSSLPQRYKSPSRRSVSPQQSTSRYKSRSSKRSISPHNRSSSHQQYSRSPSPASTLKLGTSPNHRSHSHIYSSSRRSSIRTSRSPSPTRSSKSHTSLNHRSRSHRQSSSRISPVRAPSRSPSFERPGCSKQSNFDTSSRLGSSRYNKSPSYQRSPSPHGSHVHSPKKSSSRYKSYDKSPLRKRSLSPRKSPRRSPVPSDKSNHPKSSGEKSKRSRSPIRPRKFPIEDDYTRILAEEMKKRQIWDGSDLEEETEVTKQNAITVSETSPPLKKESARSEEEVKIISDNKLQSNAKPQKSKFLKVEIKSEPPDEQTANMLGLFYCQFCQLSLNSEITWQSHITGKKHAKMKKMHSVHDVAKNSIPAPSTSFASEDAPRFNYPFPGKIRRPINDTPRLQPAIDDAKNYCLIGLNSVWEIQSGKDTTYYCELCDAPCSAHSIMPHLIGYKHQLRFLKEIDPTCYERHKMCPKKDFEYQLSKILSKHEQKHGRGQIKVFAEKDDTGEASLPGSSWSSGPPIKTERDIEETSRIPANDECLDTSKSDFYCKLCDAHMNNLNMWESHVRGKRHLRNAKKIPGESISKLRSVKAPPHVASKLDKLISENAADEIIVGLDSIRETQGPNGETYTCFPCGSNCTSYDIIDHLFLTKHKIKYLEKLVIDGKPNGITTICQMEIHDEYYRKRLIDDQCFEMMQKYGSGTAEVYLAKK